MIIKSLMEEYPQEQSEGLGRYSIMLFIEIFNNAVCRNIQ